jgi:hypothetical protein
VNTVDESLLKLEVLLHILYAFPQYALTYRSRKEYGYLIGQFQNIVLHICLHFPTKRILLNIITNLDWKKFCHGMIYTEKDYQ